MDTGNGKISIANNAAKSEPREPSPDIVKRKRGRPRKSDIVSTQSGTGAGAQNRARKIVPETAGDIGFHSADFQVNAPFVEYPNEPSPLEFLDNVAGLEDNAPRRRGRVSKSDKAYNAADELVTIANILAVSIAGPEAGMNMIEQPLITGSLARTLATNNNAEKVAEKMTPFTLIIGVSIWALRVGKLAYDKNKDKITAIREKSQNLPKGNGKRPPVTMAPDMIEVPENGAVTEADIIREMLEHEANI